MGTCFCPTASCQQRFTAVIVTKKYELNYEEDIRVSSCTSKQDHNEGPLAEGAAARELFESCQLTELFNMLPISVFPSVQISKNAINDDKKWKHQEVIVKVQNTDQG